MSRQKRKLAYKIENKIPSGPNYLKGLHLRNKTKPYLRAFPSICPTDPLRLPAAIDFGWIDISPLLHGTHCQVRRDVSVSPSHFSPSAMIGWGPGRDRQRYIKMKSTDLIVLGFSVVLCGDSCGVFA